jgi:hypothetical protein
MKAMRGLSLGFVSAAQMRVGKMNGALAREARFRNVLRDVVIISLFIMSASSRRLRGQDIMFAATDASSRFAISGAVLTRQEADYIIRVELKKGHRHVASHTGIERLDCGEKMPEGG